MFKGDRKFVNTDKITLSGETNSQLTRNLSPSKALRRKLKRNFSGGKGEDIKDIGKNLHITKSRIFMVSSHIQLFLSA